MGMYSVINYTSYEIHV